MPVLTSPQRILRAIARNPDIDRIPLIFRAEPPLMRRLREQLNLATDLDVLRHFDADSIQVGPVFLPSAKKPPDAQGRFTDILGARWR